MANGRMTQAERITSLEVRLQSLEQTVLKMDDKLDELLRLRYKGAGAFWLASALIGTGIVGIFAQLMNYIRS